MQTRNNLYLGENSSDVLTIGGQVDGSNLEEMTANQIPQHVFRSANSMNLVPLVLIPSQVNDAYLGMFVTFENMQFPTALEGETFVNPFDDFDTIAVGTLNLLEATRQFFPESSFVHLSTNKVYGDAPNLIKMKELETRYDYDDPNFSGGIDENFTIDQSKHSLFGASKVSADIMVQEYGRYFNMKTCCLRGGCLTGPSHSGVELHGFLSYLIKCNLEEKKYTIFGYKGKQVRDNIHSYDVAQLINAPNTKQVFWSKGATESLNLLAHGLGELCRIEHALWQGDEIIILTSEHHANILPWQQLVSRLSPMKKLRVTPVSARRRLMSSGSALRTLCGLLRRRAFLSKRRSAGTSHL